MNYIILNEDSNLEEFICEIRGKQVMLNFEILRIKHYDKNGDD